MDEGRIAAGVFQESAMSKKTTKTETKKTVKPTAKAAVTTSPVRYSALPKLPLVTKKTTTEITSDRIAFRAFEIFQSGAGSDDLGNWLRAEAELKTAA
jgi:hypothetical protein